MMNFFKIFFVSMMPLVELRLAVPMGIAMGLPVLPVYLVSIIGNMIPVPFIFLYARKLLLWGQDKVFIGKFFSFCLRKGERAGEKLKAKANSGIIIALILFVGVPVPGTGAWTGTLAASILNLDFKSSVIACMLGVLISGIIMGLVSMGLFSFIGIT